MPYIEKGPFCIFRLSISACPPHCLACDDESEDGTPECKECEEFFFLTEQHTCQSKNNTEHSFGMYI